MLRTVAILFGLIMLLIGILGFLPDFTPHDRLFTLFLVNPLHNLIHLATGVVALVCGLKSGTASRVFFILIGLLYAAFAIYGFRLGQGMLLDLVAVNRADNWLHGLIAIICLYFGLFMKGK